MMNSKRCSISRRKSDGVICIVFLISLLSCIRVWFLKDVFWDDNCWLLSLYESKDLQQFLNTGFIELRRVPLGTFLYYFFSLYKETNYFYEVAHFVNILLQVGTPILLYLLIRNLCDNRKLLATLVAVIFVAYPLDTTLPIFTNIVYRIGIFLTFVSFYFTERAVSRHEFCWKNVVVPVMFSCAAVYVFMEGAIALEPARLVLIGYALSKKKIRRKEIAIQTLKCWAPFIIAYVPLIIYKINFRPYGLYVGEYHAKLSNLYSWDLYNAFLKHFKLYKWKVFSNYTLHTTLESISLGILAAISVLLLFKGSRLFQENQADENLNEKKPFKADKWTLGAGGILLLGFAFLIPPLLMYQIYGKVVALNPESRHGIILQPGYSMIVGCFLYGLLYISQTVKVFTTVLSIAISFVVGTGIYFNNLNFDMYSFAWKKQGEFWNSFTQRFHSLPSEAVFMIHVEHAQTLYDENISDVDNAYDLEFTLNMLYARASKPQQFRRYKVFMGNLWPPENQHDDGTFLNLTHFGREILNPRDLIVVAYIKGELLVNREILEKYPHVAYAAIIDKEFPKLPRGTVSYPLRGKLKGYS